MPSEPLSEQELADVEVGTFTRAHVMRLVDDVRRLREKVSKLAEVGAYQQAEPMRRSDIAARLAVACKRAIQALRMHGPCDSIRPCKRCKETWDILHATVAAHQEMET